MASRHQRFSPFETTIKRCPNCRDVQERKDYADRFIEGRLQFVCPSCGHGFPPADPLSVTQEVYDVLSMHQCGDQVDQVVEALLRYEGETRELVGITADLNRAIFFESERHTVVAVKFDSHGVTDRIESVLTGKATDIHTWLRLHRDDLRWEHPRYE